MIITKSKIKTFNNNNKYLKKYGGKNNENNEQEKLNPNNKNNNVKEVKEEELKEEEKSNSTNENNGKENSNSNNGGISKLEESIKNNINDFLTLDVKIELEESDTPEDICNKLSSQKILAEFQKNLFNDLNEYFSTKENVKIDGHKILINNNLNLLIFSKIINGKIKNADWPPKKQKELFRKALKTRTLNKMSSMFSMFSKKKNNK